MFQLTDDDGNGNLSVEEIWEAYRENADSKFILNSTDITSDNMDFFCILDKDLSDEVNYEEFDQQLHMIREFESHTMPMQNIQIAESLP